MIVSYTASALWDTVPPDALARIGDTLARHSGATVFFRADDVAIPSAGQDRLLGMFAGHGVPLCAALVPAWMNAARWDGIRRAAREQHHLFAWHQHGWNHRNHEPAGKKQEFGPGASADRKRAAIVRGRDKLAELLGERFLPVFTPPWNRLDADAMDILLAEGFLAVSRYRGARPPALPGLPDIPVNVDLHTRRETSPREGWEALLAELDQALDTGRAGFMIHHQRMNAQAFAFLDALLPMLRGHAGITLAHFGDILGDQVVTRPSHP